MALPVLLLHFDQSFNITAAVLTDIVLEVLSYLFLHFYFFFFFGGGGGVYFGELMVVMFWGRGGRVGWGWGFLDAFSCNLSCFCI